MPIKTNQPCGVCGASGGIYNFITQTYMCTECFNKWLKKWAMIGMCLFGLFYLVISNIDMI